MITVVDYGISNLGSIANMLRKIGESFEVSSVPEKIRAAEKLILPGVGSFDNGMRNLEQRGLIDALNNAVVSHQRPILGICLGMQLFTNGSEEGVLNGLGWLESRTVKFAFEDQSLGLKIPHMGWNTISVRKDHTAFQNLNDEEQRFYFVHSYHVVSYEKADVLAETHYGYDFVSAIQKGNIIGVQFHPEKSHRFGMNLLSNFARDM